MDLKSIKFFALVFSLGLAVGCEQKGKVTKRSMKKLIDGKVSQENTPSDSPIAVEIPRVTVNEGSKSATISLNVSRACTHKLLQI